MKSHPRNLIAEVDNKSSHSYLTGEMKTRDIEIEILSP